MRRIKFASQADPKILKSIRELAKMQGRQFQVVLEEAMRLYLEDQLQTSPRKEVMAHFKASMVRNRLLGELLSK